MKNDITKRFEFSISDADLTVQGFTNRIYECGHNRPLAHQLKVGDAVAIRDAVESMRWLLPQWSNVAVVPMPSHLGYPTYTLQMARLLGGQVYNILRCPSRETLYQMKKSTGKVPHPEDLGFYAIGTVPPHLRVVFIDNVVATGTTALAAYHAIGRGIILPFALTLRGNR